MGMDTGSRISLLNSNFTAAFSLHYFHTWPKPLKEMIRTKLIPALTGQNPCNDNTSDLIVIPVCVGGLAISNPCKQSGHFHSSQLITATQTNFILQQSHLYPAEVKAEQMRALSSTTSKRRSSEQRLAKELQVKLPSIPSKGQ